MADAIAANDYVSFTVTPDAGYKLDLSTLTLKAGYTNSRADTFDALTKSVLSNVDGFTEPALLGEVATDNSVALDTSGDFIYQDLTIDLSALARFQGITTATEFRVYIYDDNNYSPYHRLDDVVLSGGVSLIQPPNAPVFDIDPIDAGSVSALAAFNGSIAGAASDPDGDPLSFSKVDGPEWLQVAADGALSGTPQPADMGANSFTVRVTDNDEGSDTAKPKYLCE